ncbi:hypothetical protein AXK11_00685 [Cephaloticoccus primus]|uniref:Tetratricopeptide repeat-like domain-containing protein n=1 Tax=Cephaloticoccus primus TaxID=1548207 RepID=A0A139SM10_9BACT|nr:hypothetical protein AXK11_00685 [Cephaloticoccus primus]
MVLVVIVARGASDYFGAQSRQRLAQDYAVAAATPEGLRRFAEEHGAVELGGVAWLQVADAAYEASDYSKAASAYEQSLRGLVSGSVLADRAALGLAVSQLKSEQAAKGRERLAALADAPNVSVAIRAEAAYHLAISAHVAGDLDSFQQRAAQVAQIDPMSLWNQRLMSLQVTRALPGSVATSAAPSSPASSASQATSPSASASSAVPAEADSEPLIRLNLGN